MSFNKYINYEELDDDSKKVINFLVRELEIDNVREAFILLDNVSEFLHNMVEDPEEYDVDLDTEVNYIR